MRISMDEWLRGCVYHDGRNGEVTLPTDKVLEIADYIQHINVSVSEGFLSMPPYADTPQTERRTDRDGDVWEWRGDAWYCIGQADTPQTDLSTEEFVEGMKNLKMEVKQTESTGSPIGDYRDGVGAWQTDCGWRKPDE